MAPGLFQLAYISSATRSMDLEELEALLEGARSNNGVQGITGMLLYSEGAFIQILEGKEAPVRALYERIRQDRRHTRPIIVHEGPLSRRNFPDWRMGFRVLDPAQLSHTDGFADLLNAGSGLREAMQAHPTLTYRMLLAFSRCSGMLPDLDELKTGAQQQH